MWIQSFRLRDICNFKHVKTYGKFCICLQNHAPLYCLSSHIILFLFCDHVIQLSKEVFKTRLISFVKIV